MEMKVLDLGSTKSPILFMCFKVTSHVTYYMFFFNVVKEYEKHGWFDI